ncbi:MAG: hypothetical protein AAGA99_12195 [Actinomycetota bacterium]
MGRRAAGPASTSETEIEWFGDQHDSSAIVERGGPQPALIVLAVLAVVAVLWGLTGGDDDEADETAPTSTPPEEATAETAASPTVVGGLMPRAEMLPGFVDTYRLVLLEGPFGFGTVEPTVSSFVGREVTTRLLGSEIFVGGDPVRTHPGERRAPLVVADDSIAVLSEGRVVLLDIELAGEPFDLGPGIAVLEGTDDDEIWVLGSAEETARRIDVRNPAGGRTFDLDDLGRPIAAVGDGLLLSVGAGAARGLGYWRPDAPLVVLEGSERGRYLGNGAADVVIAVGEELVVFDLTAADAPDGPTARRLGVDPTTIDVAAVAPDGRSVAFDVPGPITERGTIRVVGLDDGAVIDEIRTGFPLQFQWSGATRLLHLQPELPETLLVERDLETGVDRPLVSLPGLSWFWFFDTPPQ